MLADSTPRRGGFPGQAAGRAGRRDRGHRPSGRLSPEHTGYRVASARQHTGSRRAVCHALWPALVAARRTISASSARVPAHVGSRRRRSRLVDLGATSDSGISMSRRRVFGRRMWVGLPALLAWFCGGAVRAQGGRGWLALQTACHLAWCSAPGALDLIGEDLRHCQAHGDACLRV